LQCLPQESYTDASGIPFTGTYDASADLHLGFLFPAGTTGTEFIGEFVAPLARKWVGLSLGGYMVNAPLIAAWANGNKIVSTTRFTTYGLPHLPSVLDAEPLA
jgi:cellobiose dehydrogenase (acceptor)